MTLNRLTLALRDRAERRRAKVRCGLIYKKIVVAKRTAPKKKVTFASTPTWIRTSPSWCDVQMTDSEICTAAFSSWTLGDGGPDFEDDSFLGECVALFNCWIEIAEWAESRSPKLVVARWSIPAYDEYDFECDCLICTFYNPARLIRERADPPNSLVSTVSLPSDWDVAASARLSTASSIFNVFSDASVAGSCSSGALSPFLVDPTGAGSTVSIPSSWERCPVSFVSSSSSITSACSDEPSELEVEVDSEDSTVSLLPSGPRRLLILRDSSHDSISSGRTYCLLSSSPSLQSAASTEPRSSLSPSSSPSSSSASLYEPRPLTPSLLPPCALCGFDDEEDEEEEDDTTSSTISSTTLPHCSECGFNHAAVSSSSESDDSTLRRSIPSSSSDSAYESEVDAPTTPLLKATTVASTQTEPSPPQPQSCCTLCNKLFEVIVEMKRKLEELQ